MAIPPDPEAPSVSRFPINRRVIGSVAGLIVALFLGYRLFLFLDDVLSFAGKWEGKIRSTAPSPDGRYVAEVSEWNGGATTGFQTRVALRGSRDRDTVSGVTRSEGTVAVLLGNPEVRLRWDGLRELMILGPQSNYQEQRGTWRDVRVTYRALPQK